LVEATSDIENFSGLAQVDESPENTIHLTAYYKLPWRLKAESSGWQQSDFPAAVRAEGILIDAVFVGFFRRTPRECRKTGALVKCQIAAQQTCLLPDPVLLSDPEIIHEPLTVSIRKLANSQPV
jgi:hypothetical protein